MKGKMKCKIRVKCNGKLNSLAWLSFLFATLSRVCISFLLCFTVYLILLHKCCNYGTGIILQSAKNYCKMWAKKNIYFAAKIQNWDHNFFHINGFFAFTKMLSSLFLPSFVRLMLKKGASCNEICGEK